MTVNLFRLPAAGSERELDAWFTPWRFLAVVVAFIIAMFPDVIFGGRTFIFRDFGLFGYPLAYYHRESFWRGEVPLWNPLSHCGIPFLAQWNTMVLYPGSLFYLLLPLEWSLGVFNLLHLLLCAMAMYALAWSWTGSRRAACVAGVGFAFNGFTLNCLMWPNYIASLAWMPLVVLTVERAWRLGGRQIVWAALAGAMQMLSGTPEVILLTWVLLGGLWLLQLARKEPGRVTVFIRLPMLILLVAGLAAAQLLPFLDFLRFSQRHTGFATGEWALPVTGWANFLVPLFRTVRSSAGVHMQDAQGITSSYYLGISMALLALIAVWRVRQQRVRLLAIVTGLCLFLALGHAGGVYTVVLKILPVLGFVRYPVKFIMLPVFLVPLLAAFALSAYFDASAEQKKRFWSAGLILGIAFLSAVATIVVFAFFHPGKDEVWSTTAYNGLTRACFLVGILALWFAAERSLPAPSKCAAVLGALALLWADCATHAPRQNPTVQRGVFKPGFSLLAELEPRPACGQSRAMLSLEAIMAHRTKMLTNAFTGYLVKRFGMFCDANLLDGLPKVDGFFALELRRESEVRYRLYPTTNSYYIPLADFLSVSQVTSATNVLQWAPRSTWLPMASSGQEPRFLDETNTLAALVRTDFNPRTTVFLSPEDRSRVSVRNRTDAKILSSKWVPQRIALEVEAVEPSLVVLSQSFYHPWQAKVDGRPVQLLRANHAFQALEVPSGRHTVVLAYKDRMFFAGVVLSVLTFCMCVAIWVRGRQVLDRPSL